MKAFMILELTDGTPITLEVSDGGSPYVAEMPELNQDIWVSGIYLESTTIVITTIVDPPIHCGPGSSHTWRLWQDGDQWECVCQFADRWGHGRSPIWTIDPKNVTRMG